MDLTPEQAEALLREIFAGHEDPEETEFEDPGPDYDEAQERLVRELMSLVAQYAEDGPLFDPTGKYLCGSCQMRVEPDRCSHVSGNISLDTGSCEKWIIGQSSWPIQIVQWSQKEANYGTRGEAKGFGCSRCGHARIAQTPDSEGRTHWCRRFGTRVMDIACCAEESGPDFELAPGE